jgi:alkylation response protein AidB-like acyl-CoA dehydrogenase
MDFTFSEEQLFFQQTIADFLKDNVTPEHIRQRWESEDGFDQATWQAMAELGATATLVPEENGGLGLRFDDVIKMIQSCGHAALPEPIVEHSFIAAQMLADIQQQAPSDQVAALLEQVASGETKVLTAAMINPYLNFADKADKLLVQFGDDVHLIDTADVTFESVVSVDRSRRLVSAQSRPNGKTCLTNGRLGSDLWQATLNRGALANAAQLLGLAEALVEQAVRYACDREQFGKPIGTNQAVKHLLADCAVKIEFAKPVVYRAAYTVSVAPTRADWAVSHAKVSATQAAQLAARHCIQVFGAMGYTWECDVHIWAKRVWALANEWGDSGFHKNRIHEWLVQPKALLGPEFTFGRRNIRDAELID